MSSMFQGTIIGRLTQDPEQKVPASGNPYTRLRIAYNIRKDEPGYIDSTLFGKTGEIAATYLKKGSHICLAGARVEWRQWEKDGVKFSGHSLVGGDLIMLGKKDDDRPASPAQASIPNPAASDDDIPF